MGITMTSIQGVQAVSMSESNTSEMQLREIIGTLIWSSRVRSPTCLSNLFCLGLPATGYYLAITLRVLDNCAIACKLLLHTTHSVKYVILQQFQSLQVTFNRKLTPIYVQNVKIILFHFTFLWNTVH